MRRRIYEMIEKGEQEDKISLYYDRFMIFCIIASVLPLCVKNSTNPVFYRIDRITVFIFIIDYLLRWGTADFKLKGEKPFLLSDTAVFDAEGGAYPALAKVHEALEDSALFQGISSDDAGDS